MKRAHVFISGRVQGVGFRYFTRVNAQEIGINGWVRNLPDGRVEAVFEGRKDQIEKMIEQCREGPRSGRVEDIEVKWRETNGEFDTFRVTY